MKCYEQAVSRLEMARDNLLFQKERLTGKQDPVSLVMMARVTEDLTKVGQNLQAYARLGVIMPSLKS